MAKENMKIRMESELKVLRCHGIPFEVKSDEPNRITYAAMEAAEKGEDMYGSFDSVADLMEALNGR